MSYLARYILVSCSTATHLTVTTVMNASILPVGRIQPRAIAICLTVVDVLHVTLNTACLL